MTGWKGYGMVDPASSGRYARRAGLALAITAVLAIGALISGLAGAVAAVAVMIVLAFVSGVTGVYMANMGRRRAIARRDELRRQYPDL
jgi:hypothetical protein